MRYDERTTLAWAGLAVVVGNERREDGFSNRLVCDIGEREGVFHAA